MPSRLVETKGSNRLASASLERPEPVSATAISMVAPSINDVVIESSRRSLWVKASSALRIRLAAIIDRLAFLMN